MNNFEIVKPYLNELSLESSKNFVKALSICGAVLGFWGLESLSQRKVRRFLIRSVRKEAYKEFEIPKKAGGVRRISSPNKSLKQILQSLNLMLQVLSDIPDCATGFVSGRSIVTNAERHLDSSIIFNCDLKDFFPSITKEMVRKSLAEELQKYHISRDVVNMLANLVTAPREDGVEALPQGAPTSPIVSNIVLKKLDMRLSVFAEKNNYRYSRYADDITFSKTGDYRTSLPIKSGAIISIIIDSGFSINPKKTVILTPVKRQEVTGLTVGRKLNVARSYLKNLRVLLHLWEIRGYDEAQRIYTRDFCGGQEADLCSVINGKINYLCMVKGRGDSTYRRLKMRYRKLMRNFKDNHKTTGEK